METLPWKSLDGMNLISAEMLRSTKVFSSTMSSRYVQSNVEPVPLTCHCPGVELMGGVKETATPGSWLTALAYALPLLDGLALATASK